MDDNEDGAESLALLLKFDGHQTEIAHSGPEAIAAAARFCPEVVFLDIGLPGMNGYEVARALRDDDRYGALILIAVTGWGSEEDRKRSKEAGFDFHLTKPVDATRLEILIGTLDERS